MLHFACAARQFLRGQSQAVIDKLFDEIAVLRDRPVPGGFLGTLAYVPIHYTADGQYWIMYHHRDDTLVIANIGTIDEEPSLFR